MSGKLYSRGSPGVVQRSRFCFRLTDVVPSELRGSGVPLEGRRHIWWNFVASVPERIGRAKRDWAEGKFAPVHGETEFIPLRAR